MKTLWARIGVSLEVTDAEYEALKSDKDVELNTEWAERFFNDGFLDGDGYIPSTVFEEDEHLEWIKTLDYVQQRCCDCCYLVEGDNGEWICDDCGLEIHKIGCSGCPAQEF